MEKERCDLEGGEQQFNNNDPVYLVSAVYSEQQTEKSLITVEECMKENDQL